jgi:hypothetical protein
MAKPGDQLEFFVFPADNGRERWFSESGCLDADRLRPEGLRPRSDDCRT